MRENILLLGFGEVGKALYKIAYRNGCRIDVIDLNTRSTKKCSKKYDVLFVAIPYSRKFIYVVRSYQRKHTIKTVIVFSTVPVGTCKRIPNTVHSPIEGKHPHLEKSIRLHMRWMGGRSKNAENLFRRLGFKLFMLPRPEFTEFLKLRSLACYGVNIEFARYSAEVCGKLGLSYDAVSRYDADYNDLYRGLGLGCYSRYVLYPPTGRIGGHCVVPNVKLLNKQFPSYLLKGIANEHAKRG